MGIVQRQKGEKMTNRDAINLLEEVKILDDTMYAYNPSYLEALDMALTALEAEETWYATHEYPQKPQWIPCSERLPSKADHRDDMVIVCYRNGFVRFNTYMNGWVQGNPVAWMPLPEPYAERRENG